MNPEGDFLFLYGPSGAGKSSLGELLAVRLRLPFYDLDRRIETAAGQSIAEIFSAGEPAFRRLESQELRQVLGLPAGVVALGGGALLDPANRGLAERNGRVVCLRAPLEVLAPRLERDREARPLLAGQSGGSAAGLAALLERRAEHYQSFPSGLDVSVGVPEDLLPALMQALGVFYVEGMGSPYPVRVKPGGLDGLGKLLAGLNLSGPLALVCDEHLEPLYASRVLSSLRTAGYHIETILLASGEEHKTIETVAHIWDGLAFGRAGARWSGAGPGRRGHHRHGRLCRGHLPARGALGQRCRPACWRWWTPAWAARPGPTCRRARTWWARSIRRWRCWPTRACWARCPPPRRRAGWPR